MLRMGSWEFAASFCVGRSRGCEVSTPTSDETRTVSKRHVGIVPLTDTLPSGGARGKRRWLIYDLETMNGTAVNGVDIPCGGHRELQDGDEVVLASAMRQCVRLLVQFPEDSHSRIVVKAQTRSATPSPAPAHRRTAVMPSPRRSPRRAVLTNASVAAAGFGRSAVTIAGSPAFTRTGCRPLMGTPGTDANLMTPPPHSLPQKRSRSSPRRAEAENENVEKNKQQETPNSQQRKRSRRGGIFEAEAAAIDEDASSATKRAQDHEKEERERLMMCPVCLEYFHGSATLPCSHTFCGYCISNWFRTSLSCPECRDGVKTVPVRNRALDELVERLVGHTEAYKSHVRRRARMQRLSLGSRRYDRAGSDDEDVSEGAARGVRRLQLGIDNIQEPSLRCSVFTRWSVEEKLAFSSYISKQFGEARVASCKKVGLTETAVDRSNMTELLVAAQNLLLDSGGLRLVSDEHCQRLKIFLFFG
ncbi:unnamed protein product [Phytophthora fragariaefolia]|uniref:E3 ubiquitin-protein ligase CHFR n=1 Tax=Phytophthora fragariaefolia TaxID=1490495 RepID=A0A9W6U465_9STRA|nr:unnamed protein product [Phytophthora fragariaefolia]